VKGPKNLVVKFDGIAVAPAAIPCTILDKLIIAFEEKADDAWRPPEGRVGCLLALILRAGLRPPDCFLRGAERDRLGRALPFVPALSVTPIAFA
jgi:hypothetical protein